jgi:uncharacterized membrane protein YfcA
VNALTLGTERRRPRPLRRDTAVILAFAVPGALLGVAVLRALDAVALQLLVSAGVLAALAVRHLAGRRRTATAAPAGPAPRAWAPPLAGLLAGGLGTATTTSGPPLVVHLLARGAGPAVTRDTLSVCFLGLGLIGPLALLVTRTEGAVPELRQLALGVPAVVAGQLAGRHGFALLERGGHYEAVVTVALLASVAAGLASTLA